MFWSQSGNSDILHKGNENNMSTAVAAKTSESSLPAEKSYYSYDDYREIPWNVRHVWHVEDIITAWCSEGTQKQYTTFINRWINYFDIKQVDCPFPTLGKVIHSELFEDKSYTFYGHSK